MRKTYRYRNLSFAISDEENVFFTVKYASNGNTGQTAINIPGNNDPEIENTGTVLLGKGEDLRNDTTISVSDIANLAQQEDTINIVYEINGKQILEHKNLKTEEERPIIILFIKFPKP